MKTYKIVARNVDVYYLVEVEDDESDILYQARKTLDWLCNEETGITCIPFCCENLEILGEEIPDE